MSTTSLKLSEDLKARAIQAAQAQGVTPHAFMVEAIRDASAAALRRAEFIAEATASRQAMINGESGMAAATVYNNLRQNLHKARRGTP